MLELNKLYNMDCLEGMRQFPDKYFDLLITDPPYGSGGVLNGKENHDQDSAADLTGTKSVRLMPVLNAEAAHGRQNTDRK